MVKCKVLYGLPVAALAVGAGLFVPSGAWATDADDAFLGCLSSTESVCTLTDDVTMDNLYILDRDLTVDLAGHNISSSKTAKFFEVKGYTLNVTGSGTISTTDTMNTGIIRVFGTNSADAEKGTHVTVGENVTLSGPNPVVVYQNNKTAYNTTVDIYGRLQGQVSGVWMIGTISNKTNYPTVNIHDGAVISASNEDGVGVSAMGYARWNIGEATITGTGSGIGIKGGIINVAGANVTGTGNPEVLPPATYNNGINASGAAIQIEKNAGYPGDIELGIASGTFTSEHKYAIYSYGTDDIAVSVEISGGVFSDEPDESEIADDDEVYRTADGYVVANPEELAAQNLEYADDDGDGIYELMPIKIDWNDDYFEELYNDNYAVVIDVNGELIADRLATFSVEEKTDLSGFALVNGGELYKAIEMDLLARDGVTVIPVENSSLLVYIDISEEDYNKLAEYDGIAIAYFDENGNEVERLNAELKSENGWYWIEFTTTHLSTYGVVGVNETAEEAAAVTSPDTGTVTAAGASAAAASILTAVAVGVIAAIVGFAVLVRRK